RTGFPTVRGYGQRNHSADIRRGGFYATAFHLFHRRDARLGRDARGALRPGGWASRPGPLHHRGSLRRLVACGPAARVGGGRLATRAPASSTGSSVGLSALSPATSCTGSISTATTTRRTRSPGRAA